MRRVLRNAISFPALLGVLLVAGAYVSTSSQGNGPGSKIAASDDTWWHLVTGESILTTHHWPTADPYSFTATRSPWMAYEWLGDVMMGVAERAAGLQGLAALLVALAATLTLLLYYLAFLRSGSAKSAAVACALVLPLPAAFFNLRPQLIGYILLTLTLICLEWFKRGWRWVLWLLPGLFLLWVNTHGTFVLGFAVLGLYFAGGLVSFRRGCVMAERRTTEQNRHFLAVILLSVLMLAATPYGSRLAAYPLEMALLQPINLGQTTEWYPLPLNMGAWGYVFVGLLFLFVLLQAFSAPLMYRLEDVVLLAFTGYEGCVHVRFLFFFAIVFAPLLATLLGQWVPVYDAKKDKYALNTALMALTAAALVAFFPSSRTLKQVVKREYPERAVDYLAEHPGIRYAFNDEGWGGYLIWSGRKVFIDGRQDIYEYSGVLADYMRITNLDPTIQLLLRKYRVDACLVKKDSPLGTYLAALPDWKRVYADDLSAIYERQSSY